MLVEIFDAEMNLDSAFVVEQKEETEITFNDHLPLVRRIRIKFVSDDEAERLIEHGAMYG